MHDSAYSNARRTSRLVPLPTTHVRSSSFYPNLPLTESGFVYSCGKYWFDRGARDRRLLQPPCGAIPLALWPIGISQTISIFPALPGRRTGLAVCGNSQCLCSRRGMLSVLRSRDLNISNTCLQTLHRQGKDVDKDDDDNEPRKQRSILTRDVIVVLLCLRCVNWS
jgi:hypothetical protein